MSHAISYAIPNSEEELTLPSLPDLVTRHGTADAGHTIALNVEKSYLYDWIDNLGYVEKEGEYLGYARGGSTESYDYITKKLFTKKHMMIALEFHKLFNTLYYHVDDAKEAMYLQTRSGGGEQSGTRRSLRLTYNIHAFARHTCQKDKGIHSGCDEINMMASARPWLFKHVSTLYLNSVGQLFESHLSGDDPHSELLRLRKSVLRLTKDVVQVINHTAKPGYLLNALTTKIEPVSSLALRLKHLIDDELYPVFNSAQDEDGQVIWAVEHESKYTAFFFLEFEDHLYAKHIYEHGPGDDDDFIDEVYEDDERMN